MSVSSQEEGLRAGEKALTAGDYKSAIAHLQAVCDNTTDSSLLAAAQRLLVSAYEQTDNIKEAIRFCQQIQQTGAIKDQVWATTQLNQFQQAQSTSNLTGFVADTPPSPVISQAKTEQTSADQEDASPSPAVTSGQSQRQPRHLNRITQTQAKAETVSEPPSLSPSRIQWRNAPKPKNWKPLKRPSLSPLWRRILISLIAFWIVFDFSIQLFMSATNTLLVELPSIRPFQPFYRDPTVTLLIFIGIVFLFSGTLLNLLLKTVYHCQPFPLYKLTTRCPVAAKFLQTYCRQQKIPLPTFGLLPTSAPVIFSYGQRPKNARIIISEGLFKQLNEEEVITLLAGEMGMIRSSPLFIVSGAIALLQVPYTIYYQISNWGEQFYQSLPKKAPRLIPKWIWCDIPPLVRNGSAYLAQFFYLAYALWKLPLNGLFHIQHSYRDYFSVSLTGDPNAKVRGLIKVAEGMNDEIEKQEQTPWLLESFNPLLPIGYRQGLSLGSLLSHFSLETLLNWESSQPYRHQLNGLHTHPLISDRAVSLLRFAQQYQVPLELDLDPPHPSEKSLGKRLQKLVSAYQVLPLLQRSLYVGVSLGILLRLAFWIIGILSEQFNILTFVWFADTESFLTACILFIFSLSIIIGTNHYFPNIKISSANNNPSLAQWLTQIKHPQYIHSLRISGQLIGRSGNRNWVGQDLILQTETGSIFLHFSSRLGIMGNLLPGFPHPNEWIGQPVMVSGWLRRGIIPWIDVERITNHQRQSIRAGYPIWLTLLALVAAIWATHLILQA